MGKLRFISLMGILIIVALFISACNASEEDAGGNEEDANTNEEENAGDWEPDNAIEMVVTSSAGGGSDLFARTMAKIITDNDLSPQPVNVVNRPGGSASVGYSYLNDQAGNPHFLGIVSSSYYTTPLLGGSPVSLDDFEHVAHMVRDPQLLVVEHDSSFETISDLLEYGEANPGTLNAGISNRASDKAIATYMVDDESDIDLNIVPFTSGGEVLTNLLGGHVDFAFLSPGEIDEHVEAQNLRPLAASSDERLDSFPDTPTFMEDGIEISLQQSRAVILPSDVPDEAIAFYEDLFRQVSETDEWQEYVEQNSMVDDFMGYEEYTEFSYELNDIYSVYTEGLELDD